jgi:hypothetical protein
LGKLISDAEAARFAVLKFAWDGQAFGTWFVVLKKRRVFRVLWDGRNGWLFVQLDPNAHGTRTSEKWQDQWVARSSNEQTVEKAIAEMERILE